MTQIDPARVDKVGEILDLALDRPPSERAMLIAGLCAGDERLFQEATSLLRALDRAGHLLEPAGLAVDAGLAAPDLEGLVIGPYTIGQRIGAGGMGVVYTAEDTRLGRTVAVKSLPAALAVDPVRRAMLEHEAKVLAALTHPNIAAIYGIEDGPHGPVLVLEYVGGPTLAELLSGHRLANDEACTIASQILHALEAAHAAGVVHRDIKPSNVKVTAAGTVKVLDFGIAKLATSTGIGRASGMIGQVTTDGRLIGTPAYMSPEQARGRSVDRRTDLWAFGCVFYEMLAGAAAFRGETATDTIAAILRADPDWNRLPASTPWSQRRLLRRCLEKEPDRRLRDAGDARLELEDPAINADAPRLPERWRRRAVAAMAGAAVLIGIGLGAWMIRLAPESPTLRQTAPVRMTIDLQPGRGLAADSIGGCMAISPDGRTIAFVAGDASAGPNIFVRQFDAFDAVALAGTQGAKEPCFSPDGKWIAYCDASSAYEIKKVRVSGGAPVSVGASLGLAFGGLCWQSDIIFYSGVNGRIWSVASAGGTPVPVTAAATDQLGGAHFQPHALPGGNAILFTALRTESHRYRTSIESFAPATGHQRRVLDDACQPHYLPGGHLLYYQGGALMAVGFDATGLTMFGEPRKLISPLAGAETQPRPRFAVSASGTLAYLPGAMTYDPTDLAWVSLEGSVTRVFKGEQYIDSLRLSPDGRRVAYAAGSVDSEIWVHDFARNPTRLTKGGARYYPVWTPDGRRLAFKNETVGQIEWIAADGMSEPEALLTVPTGSSCYPNAFTADGTSLIFTMADPPDGAQDLFVVRLEGDRTPRRVFATSAHAHRFGARLSPDGSLIAYTSEESGPMEIYLQTFPALDRKVHVSIGGGLRSAWSGDGKTLFYRFQDRLYGVDVTTSPELAVSTPRLLLQNLPESRYDAAADGTRIILAQPPGGAVPQTRINVVLNWAGEAGLDASRSGR